MNTLRSRGWKPARPASPSISFPAPGGY